MTAMRAAVALLAAFVLAGPTLALAETPSPPGAKVYFINLKDGQDVTSPFLVQFGLSGMGALRRMEDEALVHGSTIPRTSVVQCPRVALRAREGRSDPLRRIRKLRGGCTRSPHGPRVDRFRRRLGEIAAGPPGGSPCHRR